MDKVMFKQRTEEGNELTEQKQKCVLFDEKCGSRTRRAYSRRKSMKMTKYDKL